MQDATKRCFASVTVLGSVSAFLAPAFACWYTPGGVSRIVWLEGTQAISSSVYRSCMIASMRRLRARAFVPLNFWYTLVPVTT
jgi:hypothetical protein